MHEITATGHQIINNNSIKIVVSCHRLQSSHRGIRGSIKNTVKMNSFYSLPFRAFKIKQIQQKYNTKNPAVFRDTRLHVEYIDQE